MLLTKTVMVKWNSRNKKIYESKGYIYTKMEDEFEINIEDLLPNSHVGVEYSCDYCNKKCIVTYKEYNNKIKNNEKLSCIKCSQIKRMETNLKKYGKKGNGNDGSSLKKYRIDNRSKEYLATKEFFELNNFILIDGEEHYINKKTQMNCYCTYHPNSIQKLSYFQIKNNKYPCEFCKSEIKINNRIEKLDDIKKVFNENNYIILSDDDEIVNSFPTIKSYCIYHKEIIQNKNYYDLKSGKVCKYCEYETRKGKNNSMYGSHRVGELNPNWKGGITNKNSKIRASDEYTEWRIKVFERDNYTCQCCGDSTGGNLNAHHINNFSNNEDLRFDINNGITLCNNCHNLSIQGSFHYIYGTYNNTKEQIDEYLKAKKNDKSLTINRSGGNGVNNKSVFCITTNKIFKSIREAQLFYNLPHHLGEILSNNKKYYGKLSDGTRLEWIYYEEYLINNRL